jgi:cytochrome c oxidase subunit 1
MVSSPPPVENFEEIPIIISEPYGYGKSEPLTAQADSKLHSAIAFDK